VVVQVVSNVMRVNVQGRQPEGHVREAIPLRHASDDRRPPGLYARVLRTYSTKCTSGHFTARRYAIARCMLWSCVSLSVRPCVTRRYCTKTAKRKITQTKQYNSQRDSIVL